MDYRGNWLNIPKYIDFAYTLPHDLIPIINTSGETDPASPWDQSWGPMESYSGGYFPPETLGLAEWQERLERGELSPVYRRIKIQLLSYDEYESYKITELANFTKQQREEFNLKSC